MLHKPYPLSSSMSESPLVSFEEAGKIRGGLHPNTIRQRKATRSVRHEETLRIRSLQAVLHRAASNEHSLFISMPTQVSSLTSFVTFVVSLPERTQRSCRTNERRRSRQRGRRMNRKTKTDRKATYCKRPFLLRSQKRDLNRQELKETRDIRMRENYGREGIEASGD